MVRRGAKLEVVPAAADGAAQRNGRPAPWFQHVLPKFVGPFRANISEFLREFSEPVTEPASPNPAAISLRTVKLASDRGLLVMRVYVEKVLEEQTAYCDQCRCVGWQGHPVSNVRYHFVVPALADSNPWESLAPPSQASMHERQRSAFAPPPALDIFEDRTHLLHGTIHINGFGHLQRVNRDTHSHHELNGKQLTGLWDRLCYLLRARLVSTEDVSHKGVFELRVLYPAMSGKTWYGKWGYDFGRSHYNMSKEAWQEAVDYVRKAPLAKIVQDFTGLDPVIVNIVSLYSRPVLDGDSKGIETLGELLERMLMLCTNEQAASKVFGLQAEPSPGGEQHIAVMAPKQRAAPELLPAPLQPQPSELQPGLALAEGPDGRPSEALAPAGGRGGRPPAAKRQGNPAGRNKGGRPKGRRRADLPPRRRAKEEGQRASADVPTTLAEEAKPPAPAEAKGEPPKPEPPMVGEQTKDEDSEEADESIAAIALRVKGKEASHVRKEEPTGTSAAEKPQASGQGGRGGRSRGGRPKGSGRAKAGSKMVDEKAKAPLGATKAEADTHGKAKVRAKKARRGAADRDDRRPPARGAAAAAMRAISGAPGTPLSASAPLPAVTPAPGSISKASAARTAVRAAATASGTTPSKPRRRPPARAEKGRGRGGRGRGGRKPKGPLHDGYQDLPVLDRSNHNPRWSHDRVERGLKVITDAMKPHTGNGWVCRNTVRTAANQHIGDTGLLDFLLKSVSNTRLDGFMIYRKQQEDGKSLVYRVEIDPYWSPPQSEDEKKEAGEEAEEDVDKEGKAERGRFRANGGRPKLGKRKLGDSQPGASVEPKKKRGKIGRPKNAAPGRPKRAEAVSPSEATGSSGKRALQDEPKLPSSSAREVASRHSRNSMGSTVTADGWGLGLSDTKVLSLDEVLRNARLSKRFKPSKFQEALSASPLVKVEGRTMAEAADVPVGEVEAKMKPPPTHTEAPVSDPASVKVTGGASHAEPVAVEEIVKTDPANILMGGAAAELNSKEASLPGTAAPAVEDHESKEDRELTVAQASPADEKSAPESESVAPARQLAQGFQALPGTAAADDREAAPESNDGLVAMSTVEEDSDKLKTLPATKLPEPAADLAASVLPTQLMEEPQKPDEGFNKNPQKPEAEVLPEAIQPTALSKEEQAESQVAVVETKTEGAPADLEVEATQPEPCDTPAQAEALQLTASTPAAKPPVKTPVAHSERPQELATVTPGDGTAEGTCDKERLAEEQEKVPDTPEAEAVSSMREKSEVAASSGAADGPPTSEKAADPSALTTDEAVTKAPVAGLNAVPLLPPLVPATGFESSSAPVTGTGTAAMALVEAAPAGLEPLKTGGSEVEADLSAKRTASGLPVAGLPVTPGMEAVLGKRRARTMAGLMVDGATMGVRSPSARGVPQSISPCKGVEADLEYLYKAILIEYRPELKAEERRRRGRPAPLELKDMTAAVQKLRDTKLFVKDYKGEMEAPGTATPNREQRKAGDRGTDVRKEERVRLHVSVPLEDSGSTCRQLGGVPAEVVIMSRRSTIADLKKAAAAAFTANYRIFEKFTPKEMQGIHGEAQSDRVRLTNIRDGEHVLLRGKGLEEVGNSVWRHTGGSEDWTVDCKCGTVDDDGARMIACDLCQIWKHTRCNGIPDSSAVPASFICSKCAPKAAELAKQAQAKAKREAAAATAATAAAATAAAVAAKVTTPMAAPPQPLPPPQPKAAKPEPPRLATRRSMRPTKAGFDLSMLAEHGLKEEDIRVALARSAALGLRWDNGLDNTTLPAEASPAMLGFLP